MATKKKNKMSPAHTQMKVSKAAAKRFRAICALQDISSQAQIDQLMTAWADKHAAAAMSKVG